MLNHLDLFSGIGGFSLGLEATKRIKTVAFCEIDSFTYLYMNSCVGVHDYIFTLDRLSKIHSETYKENYHKLF